MSSVEQYSICNPLKTMWSEKQIILTAVAYRVFNCFLVQTSFVPDEYWQSLEPAHKLVFGYGYLTWEWKQGLRSYIFPYMLATLYRALAFFHLDYRYAIVFSPRLCQSLFGAIADLYFYKFVKLLFGDFVAIWTLFAFWLNWFQFFCTPRTLANTLEMQLILIGLYFYPWPDDWTFRGFRTKYPSRIYLVIGALGTILRPTSAVFWLPLCLYHLYRAKRKVQFVSKAVFLSILPVVMLSIFVDRLGYGRWTFSLYNFANFNFFSGGSAHFGVHPWHWYFTNGLPTVCLTHLICVVFGIYKSRCRWIVGLCIWYIFIHSVLPHKELRFLLPVLPLLNIYIGIYLNYCAKSIFSKEPKKKLPRLFNLEEYFRTCTKKSKSMLAFLFVTNVPVILYTCLLHQRGCLDVPKYISEVANGKSVGEFRLWFLTPCHSTPLYSHVHMNVSLRFLTCEPNFNFVDNYVDESDMFHADPEKWLVGELTNLRANIDRPTHFVVFEWLWLKLRRVFEERGYKKCKTFYNTDFPQSDRQSEHFVLICDQKHDA